MISEGSRQMGSRQQGRQKRRTSVFCLPCCLLPICLLPSHLLPATSVVRCPRRMTGSGGMRIGRSTDSGRGFSCVAGTFSGHSGPKFSSFTVGVVAVAALPVCVIRTGTRGCGGGGGTAGLGGGGG